MDNIAFKCTYNNGGNYLTIGYNGTCTEDIIKFNIEAKRVWCSNLKCSCRVYYDNGFQGNKPEFPCMESKLNRDQCFGGGTFHRGKRNGKIIKIRGTGKGKIAFLTTKFPREKEIERRIIGIFVIDIITDDSNLIKANKDYFIMIPSEDVNNLYFWDYYSISNNKADWGSGLFRYLDDNTTIAILSDLATSVKDQDTQSKIIDILKYAFGKAPDINPIRNGPHSNLTGDRLKKVLLLNKYGRGGEGQNHKELKNYIANNANLLGISNIKKINIEHVFPSYDIVDILIETEDVDYTIEIETNVVLPGCHQAIKYRALRCSEKGLSLSSQLVKSIVVAWGFTQNEILFCEKYNIGYFKYKLEK